MKLLFAFLFVLLFPSSTSISDSCEIHFNFKSYVYSTIQKQNQKIVIDYYREETQNFMDALAYRESSNRHHITKGQYWGLYQIGRLARKDMGIQESFKYTFLNNENIQHYYFLKYLDINLNYLRSSTIYIGQYRCGVNISKAGLLASAHLVGASKVRMMLHSDCMYIPSDGNGTTALEYLTVFSQYNINLDIINSYNFFYDTSTIARNERNVGRQELYALDNRLRFLY